MSHNSPPCVFTLRDLNRRPAKVLEAVRKFGRAEIRTRAGEVFTLVASTDARKQARKFPDFPARWQKLREVGLIPPPKSQTERINRVIAGDE